MVLPKSGTVNRDEDSFSTTCLSPVHTQIRLGVSIGYASEAGSRRPVRGGAGNRARDAGIGFGPDLGRQAEDRHGHEEPSPPGVLTIHLTSRHTAPIESGSEAADRYRRWSRVTYAPQSGWVTPRRSGAYGRPTATL